MLPTVQTRVGIWLVDKMLISQKTKTNMKKIVITILMVLAVTFYTKVFAQKPAIVGTNEPGWTHIGQTKASFKMQNESIAVLGADEFTALRIKISDATLQIERLQVFYESGDMEDIDVRDHFHAGMESGVIPLKHPDRDIQKVAFTYKTAANSNGDKAEIDLYGLKTNQPQGSDAYRDEAKEVEKEVDEAADEVNEEAKEAGDEIEQEAEEAEGEVKEESQSLGNKIEEGTKDAAAAITDQKLKNKVGPGGETAYVDEDGKYYYISNAGEKVFITELQLKDKPDDQ
jgi:hypothetical protein